MAQDVETLEKLKSARGKIEEELGKVIIGQKETIEGLLVSMLSRGHCLLIGVPGLAKTLMISTLAECLDLKFSRIQFTPDLMPSDITGTEIIQEDKTTGGKEFKFMHGPVFANIVLADEINRTPPKTQAALLQSMQERQVSAGGTTHPLELPFFVLATQNPIEQEGTYPLPEAQLDRFMFSLWVNYPTGEEEKRIVKTTTSAEAASIEPVLNRKEILDLQTLVRRIPVSDNVVDFAVDLVRKTRPNESDSPEFIKSWIRWGAGPRAGQYLILAAKARAALNGRPTPDIDDVQFAAHPVLRHRLVLSFNAEAEGIGADEVIDKLIKV